MKRQKISRQVSKRVFRKTASRTHRKNVGSQVVMRGGIRL